VCDPVLLRLFSVGCLVMAAFVTMYNYLGYRLARPPFSLTPGVVGLVFLAYLAGTVSSTAAGRLAERTRPGIVIAAGASLAACGALLTLPDSLPAILVGIVLHTVGFFAAHSVASGLVGRRATAARAQASALYTLTYYVGASVGGWAGGVAYERGDWSEVVWYVLALLGVAVAVAGTVSRDAPTGRDGRW
jgi:MFS transporter, YNFM family, putative membrane transport protein